jgi:hypothetical protein
MIYKKMPTDWKDLEQKVADIFSDSGFLDVEVEKEISGARGKSEVDVYAKNKNGVYVCECKNWNTAIPKSVVQTFRTVINDIGANKGYLISRNGFQSGTYPIVENTNVALVDWYEFQSEMEDVWINNVGRYLFNYVRPLFRFTDTLSSRTLTDHLTKEDQEYYWKLYAHYKHVWHMTHSFYPAMGTYSEEESAGFCRKNFTFPLELGIPLTNQKINVEDLSGLRDYIIKYHDEGVEKFKELTKK